MIIICLFQKNIWSWCELYLAFDHHLAQVGALKKAYEGLGHFVKAFNNRFFGLYFSLMNPQGHLFNAFLPTRHPTGDDETLHFQLLEDKGGRSGWNQRGFFLIIHGNGAAHRDPAKQVHVIYDHCSIGSSDIVKKAIHAFGCSLRQCILNLGLMHFI